MDIIKELTEKYSNEYNSIRSKLNFCKLMEKLEQCSKNVSLEEFSNVRELLKLLFVIVDKDDNEENMICFIDTFPVFNDKNTYISYTINCLKSKYKSEIITLNLNLLGLAILKNRTSLIYYLVNKYNFDYYSSFLSFKYNYYNWETSITSLLKDSLFTRFLMNVPINKEKVIDELHKKGYPIINNTGDYTISYITYLLNYPELLLNFINRLGKLDNRIIINYLIIIVSYY